MTDKRSGICRVCQSDAHVIYDYDKDTSLWVCPVCGRYAFESQQKCELRKNPKLASYLYYHRFRNAGYCEEPEYRYNTDLSRETCDEYKMKFESGDIKKGRPVHMDESIIENWYPRTFSDRVDYILLQINRLSKHIGQNVELGRIELYSLLFVERLENSPDYSEPQIRSEADCDQEAIYMINCLQREELIHVKNLTDTCIGEPLVIAISPKGYARIDELNKNSSRGNTALVAMKFGEETRQLREAIREGIESAGYIAIFIDEVEHNNFITPELLKYIRDSKFVVAELTHQNIGAYFEEGYAIGIGKQVIQLCKNGEKLHFDIAQKNTIMWNTESEISKMLQNRIRATID